MFQGPCPTRSAKPRHDDDGKGEDLSDTAGASIGPNTTFEKDDPEERLARHEQSDVDAMGLDESAAR